MSNDFKETFKARLDQEVDAWKEADRACMEEIDTLTKRVEEYDDQIRRDLERPEGATAETAAVQMNRDHAEAKIKAARKAIVEHEPLYGYAGYDAACTEIMKNYDNLAREKLSQFMEKLSEAEAILDDFHGLRTDTGECQKMLDTACAETGTNIREYGMRRNLNTSVYGSSKETEARKMLHDLMFRMKQ